MPSIVQFSRAQLDQCMRIYGCTLHIPGPPRTLCLPPHTTAIEQVLPGLHVALVGSTSTRIYIYIYSFMGVYTYIS